MKIYEKPLVYVSELNKRDVCTLSSGYDDGDNVKELPDSWAE